MPFSITILPETVRLYRCDKTTYYDVILPCRLLRPNEIMCQSCVEDEVTLFLYQECPVLYPFTTFDPRVYHMINIHEDAPGIDHIGIIALISSTFSKNSIPILYINTYSYNLVIVSSEWLEQAKATLSSIGSI